MTIEQINDTDWLIKQDDWQLVLSTAIQQHPDGRGGFMNESTILRDARLAMKNDFVNNPLKLDEYWALVQLDPSTAMIEYCLDNHPTIDILAGIAECTAMTANPIEVLSDELVSFKLDKVCNGYITVLADVLTETIPFEVHNIEVIICLCYRSFCEHPDSLITQSNIPPKKALGLSNASLHFERKPSIFSNSGKCFFSIFHKS